jgi:hypothetical protein
MMLKVETRKLGEKGFPMPHHFHHGPHQERPGIETKLLCEILVNNFLRIGNGN